MPTGPAVRFRAAVLWERLSWCSTAGSDDQKALPRHSPQPTVRTQGCFPSSSCPPPWGLTPTSLAGTLTEDPVEGPPQPHPPTACEIFEPVRASPQRGRVRSSPRPVSTVSTTLETWSVFTALPTPRKSWQELLT